MSEDRSPAEAALVLFSGGQDSTVCLAWALERYAWVETVGFDYGQRHGVEMQARERVRALMIERFPQWGQRLGPDHRLDLKGFGAVAESALTAHKAIEMTERGLPSTFVPGRNWCSSSTPPALADRRGLARMIGGMCETDYSGYPDCRRETLDAMQTALNLGMEQGFSIETPLMWLTKAQTWALAKTLGGQPLIDLILEETHTCYLGDRGQRHVWGYGCGTCPAASCARAALRIGARPDSRRWTLFRDLQRQGDLPHLAGRRRPGGASGGVLPVRGMQSVERARGRPGGRGLHLLRHRFRGNRRARRRPIRDGRGSGAGDPGSVARRRARALVVFTAASLCCRSMGR